MSVPSPSSVPAGRFCMSSDRKGHVIAVGVGGVERNTQHAAGHARAAVPIGRETGGRLGLPSTWGCQRNGMLPGSSSSTRTGSERALLLQAATVDGGAEVDVGTPVA